MILSIVSIKFLSYIIVIIFILVRVIDWLWIISTSSVFINIIVLVTILALNHFSAASLKVVVFCELVSRLLSLDLVFLGVIL